MKEGIYCEMRAGNCQMRIIESRVGHLSPQPLLWKTDTEDNQRGYNERSITRPIQP